LQFIEHPVGNAVLSVPTAKRHIFVLQIMEIIRILGHRTPKFFRNAEDSVPYSVFQQTDKLKFAVQPKSVAMTAQADVKMRTGRSSSFY